MIHNLTLLDDDDLARFLAEKIIKRTHLVDKIRSFSNVNDAIEFIKNNVDNPDVLPEIILIDLNMPIKDGWDFIEEFVKFKPLIDKQIALFLLTSSILPEDIVKAKKLSEVSGYIIKPLSEDKFKAILKVYEQKYMK